MSKTIKTYHALVIIFLVAVTAYAAGYRTTASNAEQDLDNEMEDASLIIFEDGSYRAGSQVGCLYPKWGCRLELD